MAKVLFVGPDLDEVGGVSFYCAAILASYPGEIEYFSFPLNMRKSPLRLLAVLMSFAIKLMKNNYSTIQINTSLNTNAIIRDSFFILIARSLRRKIVVFFHGWEESFAQSLFGFRLFLFRAIYDKANALIVLAEHFKILLQGIGFTTKILVETTCYPPDLQRSPQVYSSELWKLDNSPQILFISRIVKEKGIFELFYACELLRSEFPLLSLYVAGDGPDLPAFRDYVAAQGGTFVFFCGTVTGQHKNDLYEASHLLCLPTYYGEGLPVTVLEAFYFGLPVITTRVGGIPGILSDGINGFFVKPGDVTDLVEKIRIILSEPKTYERISRDNLEYSKQFSPETVASRLAILHNKLISLEN